jgi:phage terminase small subunit
VPVLKNARHEKFGDDAYAAAGFKPDRGNASRLQHKDNIVQRVTELLEWEQVVEGKATEKAIDKLAITKERVLAELAKIGFADNRKVIKWQSTLVTEEAIPTVVTRWSSRTLSPTMCC